MRKALRYAGLMVFMALVTIFLSRSLVLGASKPEKTAKNPKPAEISFSGKEDLKTSSFAVPGSEWQIKWDYKAKEKVPPMGVGFAIFVLPEGEDLNTLDIISGPGISNTGSSYLYQGKGKYYLKIRAKNIESWKVDVVPHGVNKPLNLPANFQGASSMTTPPIRIKNGQARLKWNGLEPFPSLVGTAGGGVIDIYKKGAKDYLKRVTLSPEVPGEELIPGKGTYFLKVAIIGKWKIEIQD